MLTSSDTITDATHEVIPAARGLAADAFDTSVSHVTPLARPAVTTARVMWRRRLLVLVLTAVIGATLVAWLARRRLDADTDTGRVDTNDPAAHSDGFREAV